MKNNKTMKIKITGVPKMKKGGAVKQDSLVKFKEFAKSKGLSIQEAARWVMHNVNDPDMKKVAMASMNMGNPNMMDEGGMTEPPYTKNDAVRDSAALYDLRNHYIKYSRDQISKWGRKVFTQNEINKINSDYNRYYPNELSASFGALDRLYSYNNAHPKLLGNTDDASSYLYTVLGTTPVDMSKAYYENNYTKPYLTPTIPQDATTETNNSSAKSNSKQKSKNSSTKSNTKQKSRKAGDKHYLVELPPGGSSSPDQAPPNTIWTYWDKKGFIKKSDKPLEKFPDRMAKGGGIKINKNNAGKFSKYAKRKGMSVQDAAHWVMANSKDPDLRKQANFAINAAGWHHPSHMAEGGDPTDPKKASVSTPQMAGERAYADSAALYNAYLAQKAALGVKNANTAGGFDFKPKPVPPEFLKISEDLFSREFGKGLENAPPGFDEFLRQDARKKREELLAKYGIKKGDVPSFRNLEEYADYIKQSKDSDEFDQKSIDLIKKYKNLGIPDAYINFYGSPDVWHPKIKPTGLWTDESGYINPIYVKPTGNSKQQKQIVNKQEQQNIKEEKQLPTLNKKFSYYKGKKLVKSTDKALTEFPEEKKYGGYMEEDIPEMAEGGIPERYKNMGFTHVGQKKKGDGKHKWKVLAKKGDKYKVVQGGYRGMDDYTQHHNEQRRNRFWQRMGGKDSAKANDPFSPLYWHKKLGTWAEGGMIPNDSYQMSPMDMYQQSSYVPENNSVLDEIAYNLRLDTPPVDMDINSYINKLFAPSQGPSPKIMRDGGDPTDPKTYTKEDATRDSAKLNEAWNLYNDYWKNQKKLWNRDTFNPEEEKQIVSRFAEYYPDVYSTIIGATKTLAGYNKTPPKQQRSKEVLYKRSGTSMDTASGKIPKGFRKSFNQNTFTEPVYASSYAAPYEGDQTIVAEETTPTQEEPKTERKVLSARDAFLTDLRNTGDFIESSKRAATDAAFNAVANTTGRNEKQLSDGDYEYQVDNPLDLENSVIRSRRVGTKDWVTWDDKNMPQEKRKKAIANLKNQFPDAFMRDPAYLRDVPEGTTVTAPVTAPGTTTTTPNPNDDLKASTKANLKRDLANDVAPPLEPTSPSPPPPINTSSPYDKMLSDLENEINKLYGDNEAMYNKDQQDIKDIYRRQRSSAAVGAALEGLNALQSTFYEPQRLGTSLLSGKYQRMPISALEQQASALREQVSGLGRQLVQSGLTPSQAVAALSDAQAKTAGAESNLRFNFYNANLGLDRARYGEQQSILNTNEANRIAAEQSARTDQNQLLRNQIDTLTNLVNARDRLRTGQFEQLRQSRQDYIKNKRNALQDKFGIAALRARAEDQKAMLEKTLSDFRDELDKWRKDYPTSTKK